MEPLKVSLTLQLSMAMYEFCQDEAKKRGLLTAQEFIRKIISDCMEREKK